MTTGHKSKNKNCSVITAEAEAPLHQGDYYLAVHESVEPFELVDDDAWQAEPSVESAEQNDDKALIEKNMDVLLKK